MQPVIPRSVGTHNGPFHADEVTACALLLLFDLIDKDKIFRTRDAQRLSMCEYVCDVGGIYDPERKLFDHHQAGYHGDLSSAGMVLAYLKAKGMIDEPAYKYFNNCLIKGVDDHDNGRSPTLPGYYTFSHVIASFVPVQQDAGEDEENAAFQQALEFTYGTLLRLWEKHKYNLQCRKIVAQCMQKKSECLIFDKSLPWLESFFELDGEHHPALFVVMPAGKHWKLRGIPPSYEKRMQVRVPLPAEWAGLLEEDLKRISGIKGAIFCHKGRFISVWETKEDAFRALDYTLQQHKKMEAFP